MLDPVGIRVRRETESLSAGSGGTGEPVDRSLTDRWQVAAPPPKAAASRDIAFGGDAVGTPRPVSEDANRFTGDNVVVKGTEQELQKMVSESALRNVHLFRHGKTHIGFERALTAAGPA